MSFKNIIYLFVFSILVSKILNIFLKRSLKIREKSKRKIGMPVLNTVSLYTYDEFKDLIKEYLLINNYEVISQTDEFILTVKNQKEILFYYKQAKEYSDDMDKQSLISFVYEMSKKNVDSGVILTNGKIDKAAKNELDFSLHNFKIEYIEGENFIKEIRKVKERILFEGDVNESFI